jgi:outer membrane protein
MMGASLRQAIRVQDIEMKVSTVPEFEQAYKTAENERPELAIISQQLQASFDREKSKKAGMLPSIYARGGYTYTENEYQSHQSNMSLNLGSTWDLFNGGLAKSEADKERFRQRGLFEQKAKLVEDIKLEIESSHRSFSDAQEKLSVARDAMAQVKENVRVTRVRYNEGVATTTEVLEAIAMESKAQTNYYIAEYEFKRSYSKLMYSIRVKIVN